MTAAIQRIEADALRAALLGDAEIALLDVREEGVFSARHILTASNTPLSRLELLVPSLVPRRSTPVVLCDDDERLAARAAAVLLEHGYGSVAILRGGMAAWAAAGHAWFSGVYVPSKAFGEFVEHAYGTPHIEGPELKRRLEAGDDIVVLDSRPFDEYQWVGIPGAISCPASELVLRAHAVAPSPDTLVVVNCGGRTRSIIGTQILIDAGLPNTVVGLKDGTQGWHLAGLDVARGQTRVAPLPDADALAWAKEAAGRLSARFGVRMIDAETLAQFERESKRHTLYRFDVRGPDDYARGHRGGFRSAPGVQLVQATDTFVAVCSARIVLADSDGVRAPATAAWLNRMGFANVFVLDLQAPGATAETGMSAAPVLGLDRANPQSVGPDELTALLQRAAAVVVDLATSRDYRAGHIPGAWFVIRSRFAEDAARLPAAPLTVLTSPDGTLAQLAAAELAAVIGKEVKVFAGGTAAWRAAGHAVETDAERLASQTDDVALKAFEQSKDREAAMREYLSWEVGLVEQVRRDGTLQFRL
jgi:rhodanese-related sulfurtransferase